MLELKGIRKVFGGIVALDNVSLKLEKGELLGLIGPNGAGKTTLFNVIGGVYKPDSGRVFFNGEDITGKRPDIIAKRGLLQTFQLSPVVPPLSVLQNVALGYQRLINLSVWAELFSSKREKEVEENCLEILNLLGLARVKNEVVKNLPLGLQRFVALGIALAGKPEILLLDEPLAGLNADEVEDVMRLITRINQEKGVTMLLIDHTIDAIMAYCHRVAVLHYGRKIAEGTPEYVQKKQDVIEAYLGT